MNHRSSVMIAVVLGLLAVAESPSHATAPTIRMVKNIIGGPSVADTFRRPRGIIADRERNLFVIADTGKNRVVLFDGRGRCRGAIASDPGRDGRQFAEPSAVALDDRGRLFVVDPLNHRIEVLTPYGTHLAYVEPPVEAELASLLQPQDIAVGASGRLYVLYGGPRPGLLMMRPNGTEVTRIGFRSPETGPFLGPISVAVNAAETRVAVIDPAADLAVLLFDPDGTPRASFGAHGDGDGTFSMAVDATWGPHDTLWVTDTLRHSISVFQDNGDYLGRIGGFGHGPGQFNYPAGCEFLTADRIVVLERASGRCQVIEVDIEEPLGPASGSAAN